MDDEEPTHTEVQVIVEDGLVRLEFSNLLRWINMSPDSAEAVGQLILDAVKVAKIRQVQ